MTICVKRGGGENGSKMKRKSSKKGEQNESEKKMKFKLKLKKIAELTYTPLLYTMKLK